MTELVKERPANPIEFLASYLIRHDPQRAGANTAPPQMQGSMNPGPSPNMPPNAPPMHR